jgi:hypothetical protein
MSNMSFRNEITAFLPPAARGTLFEKIAPLDPPQKLLINFRFYKYYKI